MGIRRQDADFTLGGEDSVVFYPVTISSTYSGNAFNNFLPAEFLRNKCAMKY